MNIKKLLALILVVVLLLCAIPVAYALEEQPAVPGDEDIPLDVEQMDPSESEEEVVLGDADNDGVLTLFDAVLIMRYVNNLEDSINTIAADVDGDESLTLFDAVLIMREMNNWDVPEFD